MQNNASTWYYRNGTSQTAEGPIDFVELAGLLAAGDVTGDTLTRNGTTGIWLPFRERNEIRIAREMPQSVILKHLEEKAAAKPMSPFRWVMGLFWLSGGVLVFVVGMLIHSHGKNRELSQWLIRALRMLSFHHDGN